MTKSRVPSSRHLLALAAILALTTLTTSKFTVEGPKKLLKDSQGFYRVFHGVNVAYKIAPYLPPDLDTFDFNLSFCEEDAKNLVKWGQTVIRLTVYWPGIEPTRGAYNETYIANMKRIVQIAGKYGIQVLIDLHQDSISKFYCGEGLPDWAVDRQPFPTPLNADIVLGKDGYPTLESCLKLPFVRYYWSDAVQQAFQDLYDNKNGIKDAFANMWQHIASELGSYENVIGYEIINEPWVGDVNKNKILLFDGGNKNLLPLYQLVHQKIRQVDSESIVFFECALTDLINFSLTKPPATGSYLNRLMQSYHVYCSPKGDPRSSVECDAIYNGEELGADVMRRMWGVGGFMTEFGAISGQPGPDMDTTAYLIELAANKFHSWTFWQFKYYNDYTTLARPSVNEGFYDGKGNLLTAKVALLARPYATKICGEPTQTVWKSGTLNFQFRAGSCAENAVHFFLSKEFHFQNGFNVDVQGAAGHTFTQVNGNYYKLSYTGTSVGTPITVKITKK